MKSRLASPFVVDLARLGEALLLIVVTWFLLGWNLFDRAITQADGTWLVAPYVQSALDTGPDWTEHLYRFGVLGGSKLHDFGGTMPLVQLASLLGWSTTTTLNATTILIQLSYAYFGLLLVQALVNRWRGGSTPLPALVRISVGWLCAFAPLLGWRLAYGHENLLLGTLPFYVAIALVASARDRMPSPTTILFAAFAIANGVSGLGPQMLVYSIVFGLPVAIVVVLDGRGAYSRNHLGALCALLAGLLPMLPRIAGMLANASGDDATRSLSESVTYSYGSLRAGDLLASVPWSSDFAARTDDLHERNYPLGPLLLVAIACAPRASLRLAIAIAGSALVAALFASNVGPFGALAEVPGLSAFRVPGRALIPLFVLVPPFAIAALLARTDATLARKPAILAIALAAATILAHGQLPAIVVEAVAWLAALALVIVVRVRPTPNALALLPLLATLSVHAFDMRFPRDVPHDTVEGGPAELRTAMLAQVPEAADPLHRVAIAAPPRPFDLALGFAARLATLDGIWYPPRRFHVLLGALSRRDIRSTSAVFQLTRSSSFVFLQQLYNVRHVVEMERGAISDLPPTPGPAWFPTRVVPAASPTEIADRWRGEVARLRDELLDRAYVLPGEGEAANCAGARLLAARVEPPGARAVFDVAVAQPCVLVVAANYVTTLHAHDQGGAALRVFPIDIALVGIAVPAATTRITLGATPTIPAWTRLAAVIGIVALLAGIALALRRRVT